MKTTLPPAIFARQRPSTLQELLRLFAAGHSPRRAETLRYLAAPHYRMLNSHPITLASDGRIYLWAHGRCPGFSDYQIPPAGYGYPDVAAILNGRRSAPIMDCPEPAGPWGGNRYDTVWLLQTPVRIRRYDLARLSTLDTVRLGPGEEIRDGVHRTGWRTVSIGWRHNTWTGAGVLIV